MLEAVGSAPFLGLSRIDRAEALAVAAELSGRPASILEKDVWVVLCLSALFESDLGAHLSFKGGTSLSKAHGIIARFSEDVDLTYDVRCLLPEIAAGIGAEALPPNRSQEQKWSRLVRARLPEWVEQVALPSVCGRLDKEGLSASPRAAGEHIRVEYESVVAMATDYVAPHVRLEFGARSTGEPVEVRLVLCDAAPHLPALSFPAAAPRVLVAERTFWEKATAVHAFCLQGSFHGERFSRHWYDLAMFEASGRARKALLDRDLGRTVARHKQLFFPVRDESGAVIDYSEAVEGGLRLVPHGRPLITLADDYRRMLEAGLLEIGAPTFEEVVDLCRALEDTAKA